MKTRAGRWSWWVALAVAAAGCGEVQGPEGEGAPPVQVVRQGIDAPVNGYPSPSERLLLYLTNRARTEPGSFNELGGYEPSAPLRYDVELGRAARFHARHFFEPGCYCEDHSSCCALESDGTGGARCVGAPGACGMTSAGERVSLFSSRYSGENQAMGQRSAHEAMAAWIGSPGHWENINQPSHTLLGAGNFDLGWVQDFGSGGGGRPVAEDGAFWPDGQLWRFGITYFQQGTGGARSVKVVVGRECHDMDLVYGTPEWGAFEEAVQLEKGCHRVVFQVVDGEGTEHTHPSRGSFGLKTGGVDEECPFYHEKRPEVDCAGPRMCETGDTEPCYTVSFDRRNVGKCEDGTRRCVGNVWQEECRHEVLPDEEESCDNGVDDDCDGEVDEGCGSGEDAGAEPDAGGGSWRPAEPPDDEASCSSAASGGRGAGGWLIVGVLGVMMCVLRRRGACRKRSGATKSESQRKSVHR